MSERPLVSIIIDNYNYGRFLKEAIDSALAQTYSHLEVIVVDDGSTDDSQKIIGEYGELIRAVFKENGGQASAFNAGLVVSRGTIILFLDADDTLLPMAVEKAVESFDSAEVVAKVHWPLWRVDSSGKRSGDMVPAHSLAEGSLREMLVQAGPSYCCGTAYNSPTSGNAWSRSFLERVFPLPEADFRTGGVDFLLSVLSPVYGLVRKVDEPQGCYRVHGSNDTLKSLDAYLKTFFGWFEQAHQDLNKHLLANGLAVDTGKWKRDSWYHRIGESIRDITRVVPPSARFILVDANEWGTGNEVAGRHCIPFLERDGQYWGAPADDASAIEEIERQRENGAGFIFFAWSTFWWLDHYAGMHRHLRANYTCILENDRLVGFALQAASGNSQ